MLNIIIPNMDDIIEINELQEVKTPIYFDSARVPTSDGLFSYEIFGKPASYDRKTIFAYIDLKGNYLHPNVYKNLIRINRKFDACIAGTKNFIINSKGQLEESENGSTGLDFLYDNWSKLVFLDEERDSTSLQRSERTTLLSDLKRNQAFMSKQIVIPCFYRDINFTDVQKGIVSHDTINDIYAKLLRTVSLAVNNDTDFGFSFVGNATKKNIQSIIIEIYNYFSEKIRGKNGIFRKSVLGKSVDQVGRSVISSSHFNYNRYNDCIVQFDYVGVPLYQTIKLFFFFIMQKLMLYIDINFKQKDTMLISNKSGKTVRYKINPVQKNFTYEGIKNRIEMFDKAPTSRFDIVTIDLLDENGKNISYPLFIPMQSLKYNFNLSPQSPVEEKEGSHDLQEHLMTWTDLFYIMAEDVVKDKHVYITRYPITNYLNTYPSKIHVLSTVNTQVVKMGEKIYPNYPIIKSGLQENLIQGEFLDALQIFNGSIHALNADFDGDQVTIRGVFTQEANIEAEKLIYDKKNILSMTGKSIRGITREGVAALYELTKD